MEMQPEGGRATLWVARAGLALAGLGVIMELVSGWGYRHGWWGLRVALRYLFGYGGVVAGVAAVVSLVALVLAIALKSRGATIALIGVVLGVMPGVAFYRQYRLARSVPPINDVSTDLANPPAYVTAATNDFWKGKDLTYPAGFADSVRRGYPDLGSLVLPLPAAQAYGLAHRTAIGTAGWEVTGTDSGAGRIEATATTKWFGFKDDIVIRVAPRGTDSAVVDMRSKSRVGRSDVGANAARIRSYFAALRRAAGR
ncbi:MAG TPA: DUF1499 domain-containing protein [Gemmatimonadales bacterium]